ncbi:MAG: hypothetical protein FWE98_01890 [Oscillospiraceae bacterium]|nr:hypothetical protein [Oscillospiraceae bacterium]
MGRQNHKHGAHTLEAFEQGFRRLDELLGENGLSLHIIVCGGYLVQRMGIRGTTDVDAFYTKNEKIEKLIHQVGVELKLNTAYSTWLNRSVATMSDWPDRKFHERLYTFDNLIIDQVITEYLLGMKLRSTRDQDVMDTGHLFEKLGVSDPIALYNHLNELSIDVGMSYILTAFSELNGEGWFGAYFRENQQELLKLFRLDDKKGRRSM